MTRVPPLSAPQMQRSSTRRRLLWLGTIALLYPLLRFIGFRVPVKPRKIEINSTVPASGVLVLSEVLLFDREGVSWAVPRKCTHLGCKLNYHEQQNVLECPCHQSRFSIYGQVLQGPAKRDLLKYGVEKRETAPFYVITV